MIIPNGRKHQGGLPRRRRSPASPILETIVLQDRHHWRSGTSRQRTEPGSPTSTSRLWRKRPAAPGNDDADSRGRPRRQAEDANCQRCPIREIRLSGCRTTGSTMPSVATAAATWPTSWTACMVDHRAAGMWRSAVAGEFVSSYCQSASGCLAVVLSVCLPLKGIIPIGPAHIQPEHQPTAEYAGPSRSPSLELADVDQLVGAGNVQRGVRLPEDRVAQRERHRTFNQWKPLQGPLHAATIELDDAATDSGRAARAQAEPPKDQPNSVYGRGQF